MTTVIQTEEIYPFEVYKASVFVSVLLCLSTHIRRSVLTPDLIQFKLYRALTSNMFKVVTLAQSY